MSKAFLSELLGIMPWLGSARGERTSWSRVWRAFGVELFIDVDFVQILRLLHIFLEKFVMRTHLIECSENKLT